jgi:hypothetical protein
VQLKKSLTIQRDYGGRLLRVPGRVLPLFSAAAENARHGFDVVPVAPALMLANGLGHPWHELPREMLQRVECRWHLNRDESTLRYQRLEAFLQGRASDGSVFTGPFHQEPFGALGQFHGAMLPETQLVPDAHGDQAQSVLAPMFGRGRQVVVCVRVVVHSGADSPKIVPGTGFHEELVPGLQQCIPCTNVPAVLGEHDLEHDRGSPGFPTLSDRQAGVPVLTEGLGRVGLNILRIGPLEASSVLRNSALSLLPGAGQVVQAVCPGLFREVGMFAGWVPLLVVAGGDQGVVGEGVGVAGSVESQHPGFARLLHPFSGGSPVTTKDSCTTLVLLVLPGALPVATTRTALTDFAGRFGLHPEEG